jgi:hypothetical protein
MNQTPKTGSITLRFADGGERTLPIHEIRQPQVLAILDELEIKNWSELNGEKNKASLQAIRFMTKVAAIALSFPDQQETWTVERIQESFADAEQIANAFIKCLELSDLSKAIGAGKHITLLHKSGAYG